MAQPAPDTVGAIRARGHLSCGVLVNATGFALPDARGINTLWTKGGLQYAPPIR